MYVVLIVADPAKPLISQDRLLWYPGIRDEIWRLNKCRVEHIGITIGYGGEPSAFAREIQMQFTRACSKAITDLS